MAVEWDHFVGQLQGEFTTEELCLLEWDTIDALMTHCRITGHRDRTAIQQFWVDHQERSANLAERGGSIGRSSTARSPPQPTQVPQTTHYDSPRSLQIPTRQGQHGHHVVAPQESKSSASAPQGRIAVTPPAALKPASVVQHELERRSNSRGGGGRSSKVQSRYMSAVDTSHSHRRAQQSSAAEASSSTVIHHSPASAAPRQSTSTHAVVTGTHVEGATRGGGDRGDVMRPSARSTAAAGNGRITGNVADHVVEEDAAFSPAPANPSAADADEGTWLYSPEKEMDDSPPKTKSAQYRRRHGGDDASHQRRDYATPTSRRQTSQPPGSTRKEILPSMMAATTPRHRSPAKYSHVTSRYLTSTPPPPAHAHNDSMPGRHTSSLNPNFVHQRTPPAVTSPYTTHNDRASSSMEHVSGHVTNGHEQSSPQMVKQPTGGRRPSPQVSRVPRVATLGQTHAERRCQQRAAEIAAHEDACRRLERQISPLRAGTPPPRSRNARSRYLEYEAAQAREIEAARERSREREIAQRRAASLERAAKSGAAPQRKQAPLPRVAMLPYSGAQYHTTAAASSAASVHVSPPPPCDGSTPAAADPAANISKQAADTRPVMSRSSSLSSSSSSSSSSPTRPQVSSFEPSSMDVNNKLLVVPSSAPAMPDEASTVDPNVDDVKAQQRPRSSSVQSDKSADSWAVRRGVMPAPRQDLSSHASTASSRAATPHHSAAAAPTASVPALPGAERVIESQGAETHEVPTHNAAVEPSLDVAPGTAVERSPQGRGRSGSVSSEKSADSWAVRRGVMPAPRQDISGHSSLRGSAASTPRVSPGASMATPPATALKMAGGVALGSALDAPAGESKRDTIDGHGDQITADDVAYPTQSTVATELAPPASVPDQFDHSAHHPDQSKINASANTAAAVDAVDASAQNVDADAAGVSTAVSTLRPGTPGRRRSVTLIEPSSCDRYASESASPSPPGPAALSSGADLQGADPRHVDPHGAAPQGGNNDASLAHEGREEWGKTESPMPTRPGDATVEDSMEKPKTVAQLKEFFERDTTTAAMHQQRGSCTSAQRNGNQLLDDKANQSDRDSYKNDAALPVAPREVVHAQLESAAAQKCTPSSRESSTAQLVSPQPPPLPSDSALDTRDVCEKERRGDAPRVPLHQAVYPRRQRNSVPFDPVVVSSPPASPSSSTAIAPNQQSGAGTGSSLEHGDRRMSDVIHGSVPERRPADVNGAVSSGSASPWTLSPPPTAATAPRRHPDVPHLGLPAAPHSHNNNHLDVNEHDASVDHHSNANRDRRAGHASFHADAIDFEHQQVSYAGAHAHRKSSDHHLDDRSAKHNSGMTGGGTTSYASSAYDHGMHSGHSHSDGTAQKTRSNRQDFLRNRTSPSRAHVAAMVSPTAMNSNAVAVGGGGGNGGGKSAAYQQMQQEHNERRKSPRAATSSFKGGSRRLGERHVMPLPSGSVEDDFISPRGGHMTPRAPTPGTRATSPRVGARMSGNQAHHSQQQVRGPHQQHVSAQGPAYDRTSYYRPKKLEVSVTGSRRLGLSAMVNKDCAAVFDQWANQHASPNDRRPQSVSPHRDHKRGGAHHQERFTPTAPVRSAGDHRESENEVRDGSAPSHGETSPRPERVLTVVRFLQWCKHCTLLDRNFSQEDAAEAFLLAAEELSNKRRLAEDESHRRDAKTFVRGQSPGGKTMPAESSTDNSMVEGKAGCIDGDAVCDGDDGRSSGPGSGRREWSGERSSVCRSSASSCAAPYWTAPDHGLRLAVAPLQELVDDNTVVLPYPAFRQLLLPEVAEKTQMAIRDLVKTLRHCGSPRGKR